MPEKDGAEEKSTKSVVNKKQKQMMGEEGYDIARDMGRVRPSKDKKDATTMPVSDEVKKTQKVNKGPSALDLVKKKYKGQIMDVGKKKANEELDLTKVAEALGGYIVEEPTKKNKSKIESGTFKYKRDNTDRAAANRRAKKDQAINAFIRGKDAWNPPSPEELAYQDMKREAEKSGETVRPPSKGEIKSKGGPIRNVQANADRRRADAAADAMSDIKSDRKVMGGVTPEVKRAAKKTIQKPLKDRVQTQRDALTKRITDRSALRGSKRAQRQAMATGGETTGSLAKGNLEFPGDRSGATTQAKLDVDFKKALKLSGGSREFSRTFSGPKRAAAQAKRDAERDTAFSTFQQKRAKDVEKMGEISAREKSIISKFRKPKSGTRDLSTMNPDELRRRGMGGDGSGSTEGSAGVSGSTTVGTSLDAIRKKEQNRNPNFNQFQDLARKAGKDADVLRFQRDNLRTPEKMDKEKIKAVNKQVKGALDAEKRYKDAAKGSKKDAIIPMTRTVYKNPDAPRGEEGEKVKTNIASYLDKIDPKSTGVKQIPKSPSLISKLGKYTQKNPVIGGVGALVGLDAVRGGAEQIGKLLSPGNIGLRGGRVGRRSAKQ